MNNKTLYVVNGTSYKSFSDAYNAICKAMRYKTGVTLYKKPKVGGWEQCGTWFRKEYIHVEGHTTNAIDSYNAGLIDFNRFSDALKKTQRIIKLVKSNFLKINKQQLVTLELFIGELNHIILGTDYATSVLDAIDLILKQIDKQIKRD